MRDAERGSASSHYFPMDEDTDTYPADRIIAIQRILDRSLGQTEGEENCDTVNVNFKIAEVIEDMDNKVKRLRVAYDTEVPSMQREIAATLILYEDIMRNVLALRNEVKASNAVSFLKFVD